VAEKLSALQTAEFFADRKARAEFRAFDKLMGNGTVEGRRVRAMKCRLARRKRAYDKALAASIRTCEV